MPSMKVSGERYTLRLCSVVTTPSGYGVREIVELAYPDVTLQGNQMDVGTSRTWRFRPKILPLPPPDMIARLTLSDLPPSGCSCNPDGKHWSLEMLSEPDELLELRGLDMSIPLGEIYRFVGNKEKQLS